MSLCSGAKLGPYEILSPLGAGGMGEVYRAHDPRLGREVAVKILCGGSGVGTRGHLEDGEEGVVFLFVERPPGRELPYQAARFPRIPQELRRRFQKLASGK